MSTTFDKAINYASTTVSSSYTAGAGTLVVTNGSVFGSTFPVTVVCTRASDMAKSIFTVSARSTNTLTVTIAESTTDINLNPGDAVEVDFTAGQFTKFATAINAIETNGSVVTTHPVSGATNKGYLYADSSGNLKADTVTNMLNQGTFIDFNVSSVSKFHIGGGGASSNDTLVVNPSTTSSDGIDINLLTSHTADALDVLDHTSAIIFSIDCNGGMHPCSVSNSTAQNGSVYFSSTASTLVYKDTSGNIVPLTKDQTEVSITGTTTLTSAAFGKLHVCSGTSSNYTVTLPTAASATGRVIGFRMSNALTKLVTLDGSGSETIDGSLTRILWAGETAFLESDGTNWSKLYGKSKPMICVQFLSSSQSVSDSTMTKVNIDAMAVDNTTLMSDLSNKRIVIQRPGQYRVNPVAYFSSVAGSRFLSRLFVNSSQSTGGETSGASGSFPQAQLSFIISLASGDLCELDAYQNSGGSAALVNDPTNAVTYLQIEEIISW